MNNIFLVGLISIFFFGCNQNNSNPTCNLSTWTQIAGCGQLASNSTFIFFNKGTNLYRSSDLGNSVISVYSGLVTKIKQEDPNGYYYDTLIQVIQCNGNDLIAAINPDQPNTQDLPAKFYKSSDNGITWQRCWSSNSIKGIRIITFIQNKIFTISSGGTSSVSSDNGISWSSPFDGNVQYGAIAHGEVIFDGSKYLFECGGAIYGSSNNGLSFQYIGGIGGISSKIIIVGSMLYAIEGGVPDGTIKKSSDGGVTWSTVGQNGMNLKYAPQQFFDIYYSSNTLYVSATGRVFKSTDLGNTWSQLGCDLPNDQWAVGLFEKGGLMLSGNCYRIVI
jgi:hypothetical protein